MTSIVRTNYLYKRPPKKKRRVADTLPAILTIDRKTGRNIDRPKVPAPADEARGSAIVTVRKPGRFGMPEDMTPEEHKRRGDAADALFRDIVRRATGDERD